MSRADGAVSGSAAQPRRLAVLALLGSAGERGLSCENLLAFLGAEGEEKRARRGLTRGFTNCGTISARRGVPGTRHLQLNPDVAGRAELGCSPRRTAPGVVVTRKLGLHLEPGATTHGDLRLGWLTDGRGKRTQRLFQGGFFFTFGTRPSDVWAMQLRAR
jgi:hypothetical protein